MRFATLVSDVLKSLWHKPITQQYPLERTDPPSRFRGRLHWDPERCTGCALCVKDCPAQAIDLITLDKANKRFVIHYFVDRCTFCGQCIESCRFNCITLVHDEWELASLTKAPFTIYYGEQIDVETVLAGIPQRTNPAKPQ